MKLIVLGSSSAGNGYLLTNGKETLVVECGCKFYDIKKALNFELTEKIFAVVSHEHLDHSKYAKEYIQAGIPTYMSKDTKESLKIQNNHFCKTMEHNFGEIMGGFTVLPFELKHDVKCFGFLIHHSEIGKLLFVTDTHYIPYKFNGLRNILIECNYSDDLINDSANFSNSVSAIKSRVINSHLNIDTVKLFLSMTDLSNVENIVLLHLSNSNSNAEDFNNDICMHTGKSVYIADKGLEINLNSELQF